MNPQASITIIALLVSGLLQAQSIQGNTVVDQDSGEPIAYATLYLARQPKKITLSSEDGRFELPHAAANDTLVFSHVSYGEHRLATAAIEGDTIHLPAREYTLGEVIIVSETGEAILRRVIKAIKVNHDFNNTPYFSQSWIAISSSDGSELHAFYELDGFYLYRKSVVNERLTGLRSRTLSWTELGEDVLTERPLLYNSWGNFNVVGDILEHPRDVKKYKVEIRGTYLEGEHSIMHLKLTPKQTSCDLSYHLHIDLKSYAIVRAQRRLADINMSQTNCEFREWEEQFTEVEGVWHRLYLKISQIRAFNGQEILEEEFNLAQIAEFGADKQENPYSAWVEPIAAFEIPWDDPYWQDRSTAPPWPDWLRRRLAKEGLLR